MKLRLLFGIVSISIVAFQSGIVVAQTPQQSLRIQVNYDKVGRYVEEALEHIDATNLIGNDVNVEYKAGQAVTLLPGFVATMGSVFNAHIESPNYGNENALRITASPNPFAQVTTIEYYLPKDGKVSLWVMDEKGQTVRQLMTEQDQSAGMHRLEWKAESTVPGIYIPVIKSNQAQTATRLIKR